MLQGNTHEWLVEQIKNESYTLQVGNKRYELANHLGNVLAVVSDKKAQTDGVTWSAIVLSATDYYPFGMAMPGRSDGAYRYGFNGKETDPETGIRGYLPNIARFPSIDPLATYAEFKRWGIGTGINSKTNSLPQKSAKSLSELKLHH